MKRFFFSLLTFAGLSQQAFAGCHDKCVIRNPISGHCAYEVRVCPLSVDTVGRWLEGATAGTVSEAFKHIDPIYALSYYANKLGLDGLAVTKDVTSCVVGVAAGGTLGGVCAVGVSEIGAACFADITCTAACYGSGQAFKNAIKNCSGQ